MKHRKTSVAWKALLLGLGLTTFLGSTSAAAAVKQEITISSREIVEGLTRLEEGQKRLEQRIDQAEKRLEQRIDDLQRFMLWGFGVTFAGIFALMGFVIWDRRTAIAPATRGIEELQRKHEKLEQALRQFSKENPQMAETLRNLGLL